ncbi:hypothetical protein JHK84_043423 [Glycine max]|nr:hypothetical protein JHK84_043423 [Glycine max]
MLNQQQQIGIKCPRALTPIGLAAVLKNVNSTIHHYQQSLAHPSGLFPEHPNPCMSSPAMLFGMVALTPNVPPYAGPLAGSYGHHGVPMGPSGSQWQPQSWCNHLEHLVRVKCTRELMREDLPTLERRERRIWVGRLWGNPWCGHCS